MNLKVVLLLANEMEMKEACLLKFEGQNSTGRHVV